MPSFIRPRTLFAGGLALIASLALAACGGDDETIALAEWIEQADEICREADAAGQAAAAELIAEIGEKQPTEAQLEELATEIVTPNYREQLEEIRALPEPDAEQETVDEMLGALEEGVNNLEESPEQIATEEGPEGFAEAGELADEVGLEDCGG